jgi:hypothetical protein
VLNEPADLAVSTMSAAWARPVEIVSAAAMMMFLIVYSFMWTTGQRERAL